MGTIFGNVYKAVVEAIPEQKEPQKEFQLASTDRGVQAGLVREKRAGRPRDEAATAAILGAALELMEEVGLLAVTMEGIAQRSGFTKTTIYRRWPNTWSIILDGFLAEMAPRLRYEEKATVRQTVRTYMTVFAQALRTRPGRVFAPLLGMAQFNPELRDALWSRYIAPRRTLAREIIARGVSRGEIRPDVDVDAVIDTLYASMVNRLLVPEGPLSDTYLDSLVDCVFAGIETR